MVGDVDKGEITLSVEQVTALKKVRKEASDSLQKIQELREELREAIEEMLAKRDSTNK